MERRRLVSLLRMTVAAAATGACAEHVPLAPDAATAPISLALGVAGTYELTFHTSRSYWEPVWSVPVGTEVMVRATVRDAAGALATSGSVTLERCTLAGSPAPSAACAGGGGSWKRVMSVRMDPSGFPPTMEGARCSSPRSIGFRFRYSGSSAIASGTSQARDISWVAAG